MSKLVALQYNTILWWIPNIFSCPYYSIHITVIHIVKKFSSPQHSYGTITLERLEKLWLETTAWSKNRPLCTCCLWNICIFYFIFFTRSATTCSQLAFQLQLWCIKAAIKLWWESVCWQFATEWGQIDAYLQFVSDNTVINCDIFANIAKLLLSVAISMHGNLY